MFETKYNLSVDDYRTIVSLLGLFVKSGTLPSKLIMCSISVHISAEMYITSVSDEVLQLTLKDVYKRQIPDITVYIFNVYKQLLYITYTDFLSLTIGEIFL